MTRRLLLALAVLCLACPPAHAAKDPLTVIPAEAAAVVRFDYHHNNLTAKGLELSQTLMDEPLRQTVKQMQGTFGFSPLEKEFLMNFVSVTLAVFAPGAGGAGKSDGEAMVGVILEVKDVDLFQKYLEKIRQGAKGGGKLLKVSPYEKAKFPVEVFEFTADPAKPGDTETLYTAFFDNLFAVGVGKPSGVAVLEALQAVAAGNIPAVGSNESFTRLLAAQPMKATLWGYLSGAYIAQDAKREMPGAPVDAIEAAGLTVNYDAGRLSAEGLLLFRRDAKENPVAEFLKVEPAALASPAMLPAATMAYLAFRFAPTPEMLAQPGMSEALKRLGELLGVDVGKDILPWLGKDYYLALSEYAMSAQPPFPAPRLTLGVRTTDAGRCRDAMDKIEAAYKLRTNTAFEGTTEGALAYRAIVVPTGGMVRDFSLSWLVHDDYLVLASGKDAVGELSKVKEKAVPALKDEKLFKELLGGYGERTILTGYVNGTLLSEFMIRFMEFQGSTAKELADVRMTRIIRGLGFGFTSEGQQALRLRADLALDMERLKKEAAAPAEERD